MSWIYIPPIILIAALVAFLVILGRKSADLKKLKNLQPERSVSEKSQSDWKGRFKSIGRAMLHALEKTLGLTKTVFKRTEGMISGWTLRLQARRNGKKLDDRHLEDISLDKKPETSKSEENILREIEESVEISDNLSESEEKLKYVGNEVIVRRKIAEEPFIVPKKEPLPEDKVKEAALIYRIAENPKDIEAYREIGDYYMAIGNIKDAKESFKMVLKLRPRDLKAKSSLREIEMRMRLGS
jgi:hypothetical protein